MAMLRSILKFIKKWSCSDQHNVANAFLLFYTGKSWVIKVIKKGKYGDLSKSHMSPTWQYFHVQIIISELYFMCLTFPKLDSKLLLQLHPMLLQLTFILFNLWCLSWSVLAQWCASSNLSCPSKRNQDEMAGGLGHQPLATWTTNACACIMAGRFWERAGGWRKAYIQARNTRKRSSHTVDPVTKERRAALIMTIPLEDNLHYIRGGRKPEWGEGASQCRWIYETDVAWGVLTSCTGRPVCFPLNHPWHAHRTFKAALWWHQLLREKLSCKSLNLVP